jgi:KaiC/GvpD/RAD55 family RecA-like ATPase
MGALEDAYRADHDDTDTTPPSTWAAVDIPAVLAGHDLDPPPTLMPRTDGHCLLYAGAVHTISGEPETGKTWACLHAAVVELARGNTVAVVDFEDRAARVVGRLLHLGATPDQLATGLRYVRPHEALATRDRDGLWHDQPDAATALTAAVTGTALAVVDGVTEAMTIHGLDANSNADVAAFYDLLPRRIARHGPAVVLIDHVVKDTERQGRWGIGAQHKLAGVDGVAYLAKIVEPIGRGQVGRVRLVVAKDRPGHVVEHATGRCAAELVLDATTPHVTRAWLEPSEAMPVDDEGQARFTIYMERISRYVEAHQGCGKRDIREGVRGKSEYVDVALSTLVDEGYVEAAAGQRGAVHHRVLTPFRRDNEDRP